MKRPDRRHVLGWALVLAVAIPGFALAAPPIGTDLQTWMDGVDSQLADHESRIEALEAEPTTTTTLATTTTTEATTTTTVATTTTTQATTTSTGGGVLTPSAPITVTANNTIIENMHFTGSSGNCVTINGASNVTIRNSKFTNCRKGVYAVNASNVVVTDNVFEADQSDRGRNAVQFDKVTGGYIARNVVTAENGGTLAEDHFSLYQSNGTAQNPIIVEDNHAEGGGPSQSGSCIMAGDGGGSHQVVRDNTCMNPGQVGIGVASGTNVTVDSNEVTSSQFAWSNVGIYVWNQYAPACSGHQVTNNQVSWVNDAGQSNPFWNGGNCGSVVTTGNSWQS